MKKAVYLLGFLSLVTILKAQDPIGSENNPAISAAQILALNPSATDGIYWLDPDGYGGDAPFQAYCDMTTDGGG